MVTATILASEGGQRLGEKDDKETGKREREDKEREREEEETTARGRRRLSM